VYHGPAQLYGRGDGSDGKADNRLCLATPGQANSKAANVNQDQHNVSVRGQAFLDWMAPAPVVDLGSSFNRTGIVSDGSKFSGGFDGSGNALSANLLGTSLTWNGTPFSFGAPGTSDVVSAVGQTISLPAGHYASLRFLAAGVNGNQPNQKFTVTYTDSTTQTFTQSISDWYTPQHYSGESTAIAMNYRDRCTGIKDNRTFYVYGYSFPLDATKVVSGITLPKNANVELLSATPVRATA
jgi:hypothetical protein